MRKPVPPHSPQALTIVLASIERPAPAGRALVAPQLLLGLALDLADPLPGPAQRLPDLLEGLRLLAVEPEAHADHLALLLVELRHQLPDLLLEGRPHELQLDGGDGV